MKIAVCFKIVPAFEKVLDADWQQFRPALDIGYAGQTINCFDESALELGLRLREAGAHSKAEECRCIAVTVGAVPAFGFVEGLYACGYDEVVVLAEQEIEFNPASVAARLAGFFEQNPADVILTGNQAGMADTGLVPLLLAGKLGVPLCADVTDIDEIQPTQAQGCCPCVVTVGNSLAVLRAVPLRQRLKTKGKAATIIETQKATEPAILELIRKDSDRNSTFLQAETLNECAKLLLNEFLAEPDKATTQQTQQSITTLSYKGDEAALSAAFAAQKPDAVLFSAGDALRAVRFAQQTGCHIVTGVTDFYRQDTALVVVKKACASNLEWVQRFVRPVVLVPVAVASGADKMIICGGGVGDAFEDAKRLAQRLGAAFGITRAALLAGYGSHEMLVGQSGSIVAPKSCLVLGASGASAFLVGVEQAGRILAVNHDKNARIFRYADVGVCCDVQELIQHLSNKGKEG